LQKRFDLSAMRVDGHPARRRHKKLAGEIRPLAPTSSSTARLNEITEHAWADLTVSVGAGCTIQTLQQLLPITASVWHSITLAGEATVAACSPRMTAALCACASAHCVIWSSAYAGASDGTLASSGGKVVKNVAGYDLPKLANGAFGTLGMITRACFSVASSPRSTCSFSIRAKAAEEARRLIHAFRIRSSRTPRCKPASKTIQRQSCMYMFEGTEAGLSAQRLI